MKNIYNNTEYKECAEVTVYHKAKDYSFLGENQKHGVAQAVKYADDVNEGEGNYRVFLKSYDAESIQLIYEYDKAISRKQLNEMVKKDLIVISNYLYVISPEIRSRLRSSRRFLFAKEKTVMVL